MRPTNRKLEIPARRAALTAQRLRELVTYDLETGVFVARVARGSLSAGSVLGTRDADNYIYITIEYVRHAAHRLAWLYVTGEWPADEVDHFDTDPSNNRWGNLRPASSLLNKQNKRRAQAGKKYSPLLGAQWCKQVEKWKSSIRVDGHIRHLGFFPSDVAASQAYIEAKRVLHEGCTL